MAVAVVMPKLGLTMEEGTIVFWYKEEGDSVEQDEPLLEISTEKVNAEVSAPASGVLRSKMAPPGETVAVGATLAYIAAPGEVFEALPGSRQPLAEGVSPESKPGPGMAPTPQRGGSVPATLATPVAERLAAHHGVDLTQVAASGLGGRVAKRDVEAYLEAQRFATSTGAQSPGPLLATPIVKRLAQEHGVDLALVAGSGPNGLIVERDLKAYLARSDARRLRGLRSALPIRERLPLAGRRKIIAERMQQSVRNIPHIRLSADINVSTAKARRGKASVTALITWITAETLRDHPLLNASLQDDVITIFDTINIGIATDTDEGLIVPVIHGAHTLSLEEIDATIRDLTQRAREGQLRLDDVSGGTFTISNLGMLGVDHFEAIINPPQAAIMAVGRVALRPWALDETTITVAPVMSVSVSADHRILDGAAVARFLQDFKARLT